MTGPACGNPARPVRIARIISRLNIGGPAIQVITLTKLLEPLGYETLLISGFEADHEGSMEELAAEYEVTPRRIAGMGREIGLRDLAAFVRLVRELRRFRPDIVHTHAAKAGTLGRLAALVPGKGRPRVLVHTFHGHSLTGYFSPRKAALFRGIERFLAKRTTRLIAVSEEVRDDLVRLGVAPTARFEVLRLGFDLTRFRVDKATRSRRRAETREALEIPADARVVTIIARLVPIKRVDRFLRIAEKLAHLGDVWFLIVGDGELREQLQATPVDPRLRGRIVWAGFQRDVPGVCFASDVVVLCSDNEGTPVSLIEAVAASVPVVSTRVGGAASVVSGGAGSLVERDDLDGFSQAITRWLEADCAGDSSDRPVSPLDSFGLERLVDDLAELYRSLIEGRCLVR